MDTQNIKCVMVIDEGLPLGLLTNTAAVLSLTLGKHIPDMVGPDVLDGTSCCHLGITAFPIPILKGNPDLIKSLRARLFEQDFSNLTVVDFSDVAQGCNSYDHYTSKMAETASTELSYLGIAIYGDKKQVNKLTGSMPLLR